MEKDIIGFFTANAGTLYFCAIGCLLCLEAVAPLRVTKAPQAARWLGNIGLVLVNTVLVRWAAALTGVGAALYVRENGWGLLTFVDLPMIIEIAVTLLMVDLTLYLCHRLYHASDLAWRFHHVHHSDQAVDLTTAFRFHPFETVSNGVAITGAALLMGLSPTGLLLYQLCMSVEGLFGHSNIRTPVWLDRLLGMVLVTPRLHRIHHAAGAMESQRNFGIGLTIWDRMLGTFLERDTAWLESASIGIEGCEAERRFQLPWLLAQPFMRSEDSSVSGNQPAQAADDG